VERESVGMLKYTIFHHYHCYRFRMGLLLSSTIEWQQMVDLRTNRQQWYYRKGWWNQWWKLFITFMQAQRLLDSGQKH